jgi:hypothetical protein
MSKTINYHQYRLGNDHGEIRFGHVHDDEVLCGFLVRTGEDGGRHYMQMDSSGSVENGRKGGTIFSSPGSHQIICGKDIEGANPAFFVHAENGDMILAAPNGRIRILAENIDLISTGSDGENGTITIDANEKVIVNAPIINVESKVLTKIFSEKTVNVIGKAILDIYGGLIDCADGATKINGSKGGPYPNESRFR